MLSKASRSELERRLGSGILYFVPYFSVTGGTSSVCWHEVKTNSVCAIRKDKSIFFIVLFLIVNNFRDIDNDKAAGKKTLVVYIGKKNTLFLFCGIGVVVLLLGGLFLIHSNLMACLLPLLFLPFHISTFIEMKTIDKGKELNRVLGKTARNIFIYGLLLSLGILLG